MTGKMIKPKICFFASRRYWDNAGKLQEAFEKMRQEMADISGDVCLISSDEEAETLEPGDVMVAVPMSGATQQPVMNAAKKFAVVCLYPGYINGNFNEAVAKQMLFLNAAPALMDVYGVIKRENTHVFLCLNPETLKRTLRAVKGYFKLQSSRLLLIGAVEPWVISAGRDLGVYKDKLGVEIETVQLDEVIRHYNETDPKAAKELYHMWKERACKIFEPAESDILNAARLCIALQRLIRSYHADGAALACFNLLQKLNTTSCLAVSYINNNTDYVVACEGDTDSAVTMLMMRTLTDGALWMANPNLQQDKSVNFVHCTAPVRISGTQCQYTLRSHHESGIGVSTQVDFPDGLTLTACRISDMASKITVHTATGKKGVYEPSCRTQYNIMFDDFDKYIKNVLGCHQVFAFKDISEAVKIIAGLLGLQVL